MIEAMACGTPVIAYRSGSVPEVVEDGVTGFIVESEEEAVQPWASWAAFDRRIIRARFEERFSAGRMAREYERHVPRSWLPGEAETASSRRPQPNERTT